MNNVKVTDGNRYENICVTTISNSYRLNKEWKMLKMVVILE